MLFEGYFEARATRALRPSTPKFFVGYQAKSISRIPRFVIEFGGRVPLCCRFLSEFVFVGKLGSPLLVEGERSSKNALCACGFPAVWTATQLANVRLSYRPVQVPAPVADRTVTVEEEIAGIGGIAPPDWIGPR